MSTTNIRKALENLRRDKGSWWTDAAMVEVEAIEKAARAWWASESKRHCAIPSEDAATLECIAKETE